MIGKRDQLEEGERVIKDNQNGSERATSKSANGPTSLMKMVGGGNSHGAINAHGKWVTDGDEAIHGDADQHPHGHCLGHQGDRVAVHQQVAGQLGRES